MTKNTKGMWGPTCHIAKTTIETTLRGCLVPHRIQNAKCQLLWSDEMQNAKIFRVIFSSIQNAEFIVPMKPLEAHFGFFLPLEVKI